MPAAFTSGWASLPPSPTRGGSRTLGLHPYTDTRDADDRHANFKAEVALYTVADPLPTLEVLSRDTGIQVPCLIRYVLVKYAASGAEALLAMGPIVLRQMEQHIENAEALFEVLPRGEDDWKLISALLGERENLRAEGRRGEPPALLGLLGR